MLSVFWERVVLGVFFNLTFLAFSVVMGVCCNFSVVTQSKVAENSNVVVSLITWMTLWGKTEVFMRFLS